MTERIESRDTIKDYEATAKAFAGDSLKTITTKRRKMVYRPQWNTTTIHTLSADVVGAQKMGLCEKDRGP